MHWGSADAAEHLSRGMSIRSTSSERWAPQAARADTFADATHRWRLLNEAVDRL
jgi:hypothetical protein